MAEIAPMCEYVAPPKKQDICYATQNRQDAVKLMAQQCDLVLVIGSLALIAQIPTGLEDSSRHPARATPRENAAAALSSGRANVGVFQ